MKKLDKNLIKVDKNKSGICHHMIFETKYVLEFISKIKRIHNELFFDIFLKFSKNNTKSGASEYEIYFNYMLKNHPDKIKIRELKWENTCNFEEYKHFDYISCHYYQRLK